MKATAMAEFVSSSFAKSALPGLEKRSFTAALTAHIQSDASAQQNRRLRIYKSGAGKYNPLRLAQSCLQIPAHEKSVDPILDAQPRLKARRVSFAASEHSPAWPSPKMRRLRRPPDRLTRSLLRAAVSVVSSRRCYQRIRFKPEKSAWVGFQRPPSAPRPRRAPESCSSERSGKSSLAYCSLP